jgi:hypothetical protein
MGNDIDIAALEGEAASKEEEGYDSETPDVDFKGISIFIGEDLRSHVVWGSTYRFPSLLECKCRRESKISNFNGHLLRNEEIF